MLSTISEWGKHHFLLRVADLVKNKNDLLSSHFVFFNC